MAGARAEVLVSDGRPFPEILAESSEEADLAFLGITEPSDELNFVEYYARLQATAGNLPAVVLTLAAQDLDFGQVLR